MNFKMKIKRFAVILAACCLSVGMTAHTNEALTFQVNGVNYQVRENASEVVVALPDGGSQENYQYPLGEDGALVIPSTVEYEGETYAVTGVAKDAIVGQEAMTRLVLPPTMVDVMDGVHDCPALVYLDLGGASEVSTPRAPGLPLVEELRFGCLSPLALAQGSFRKMPGLKVLHLPALYANKDDKPVYTALWDSFQSTPLLTEIYSPAATPPLCIYSDYYTDNGESPYNGVGMIGVDDEIFDKCRVYLPVGSKEAYAAHRSWEAFGFVNDNLIEMNFSGLASPAEDGKNGFVVSDGRILSVDGKSLEVYSLAGVKMDSSSLSSGVYVVRSQDGTVSKVAVR